MTTGEPERFDRYMARCLYGPDGFYATSGIAGRSRGDFITSPEVGPLFGAVLANAIDGWWDALGQPEPFTVYDVGCGPGTLFKAIRSARPDRPWNLIGVDTVASPGADIGELSDDLSGSVVIANELLDNLPFRVLVGDADGTAEVFVTGDPPAESLVPVDGVRTVGAGTRVPQLDAANQWVTSVLERSPAVVCLFDYGTATTGELAARGGWLRTYRNHQRGSDPYVAPGSCDITTDIAWDQLPTPDTLEHQADFLRRWGIDELVEEGREYWREHASRPDLTAIRMRSRVSESEALLDPDGLGNWWTASWVDDAINDTTGFLVT